MGKHSCGNLLGAIGSAKAKAEDVPREKNTALEERKAAADKRKRKAAADELKEAKRLEKDAKAAEQAAQKSEDAAKKAEAEDPSRSKARVWKKTDPLKFPAYMFTKSIFKANNPLIQVICGDTHMPTFNKFSTQLRTKPSIRRAALLKCSKEICRSFSLYEDPTNEEFKSSLFRQLHHFTVPSAEALKRLENDQELFESSTGQKRNRIDRADLSDLSDQGDLIMEVGTRISWSLNKDMAIHVESQDGEEEGLMYADKKLYVRDASKDNLTNLELGDKKLVVVVEEKHKNKESTSYQGGQSAVAEIAANIIKRHTSPVYVLTLAEKWKYAILHIRGMLELKNGAIDPASLPEFREQEKAMGFADDPIPDAELRSMLEMRTKYYQSRFSDSPTSVYPDGLYPVGKYYVSDKWLYEGLLRILIGDRVINWGDEELQRVQKVRKMMRKEELELRT